MNVFAQPRMMFDFAVSARTTAKHTGFLASRRVLSNTSKNDSIWLRNDRETSKKHFHTPHTHTDTCTRTESNSICVNMPHVHQAMSTLSLCHTCNAWKQPPQVRRQALRQQQLSHTPNTHTHTHTYTQTSTHIHTQTHKQAHVGCPAHHLTRTHLFSNQKQRTGAQVQ